MSHKGRPPRPESSWREEREAALTEMVANSHRKQLSPKTPGQALYFEAINSKKIVICTGPAGSGKTHMACGKAVQLLATKQVERIVLTRPLVQCGRGYGFLKGDKSEKIAPFFRPLLDCLREFMSGAELTKRQADNSIELMPLEDMRGTTLKNAFVICDEAQNAEYFQLHMLLTRYGPGSKFVVTGDISRTQVDAFFRGPNPLAEVLRRLERKGSNPSIGVVKLTRADIVRHDLVQWMDEALGDEDGTLPESPSSSHKVKCPHCSETCFYDAGDETDPAFEDPAGVLCWKCGAGIGLWDKEDKYSPHLTKKWEGFLRSHNGQG